MEYDRIRGGDGRRYSLYKGTRRPFSLLLHRQVLGHTNTDLVAHLANGPNKHAHHGHGALFPENYAPQPGRPNSRWHCPIIGCNRAFRLLRDLGEHFTVSISHLSLRPRPHPSANSYLFLLLLFANLPTPRPTTKATFYTTCEMATFARLAMPGIAHPTSATEVTIHRRPFLSPLRRRLSVRPLTIPLPPPLPSALPLLDCSSSRSILTTRMPVQRRHCTLFSTMRAMSGFLQVFFSGYNEIS